MRRKRERADRLVFVALMMGSWFFSTGSAHATEVFIQAGASVIGQGFTRPRLGQCMVITAGHVVKEAIGEDFKVRGASGDWLPARVVRELEPDLAVLEIEGESDLCAAPRETAKDIDGLLASDEESFRVWLIQADGVLVRYPVDAVRQGEQEIHFISERRGFNFETGNSGATIEARSSGRIAMITNVKPEIGEAIALRADFIDAALEPFFVELSELPRECPPSTPIVEVGAPTRWSELLRQHPELGGGTEGWRLAEAPKRLAQAPRLLVRSDLIFDHTATLVACGIRLEAGGRWVLPPGGAAKAVSLEFESSGGSILSEHRELDKPATAEPGPNGRGHDRGGRGGCGGTEHGEAGRLGRDGKTGEAGSAGGRLTLAALSIEGAFNVHLPGRPGGPGGDGGRGGRGGDGRGASSGTSNVLDCRCGGHPGGRGGDGGVGGRGGQGGQGGAGGIARITTTSPLVAPGRFDLAGGTGGEGGHGGPGGGPGQGGNDSGGTGFCSRQRGGSDGRPGDSGARGENGPLGAEGRQEILVLQTESGKSDLEEFYDWILDEPELGLGK